MTDDEAVRRCRQGDRDAFRPLVERYGATLFGTAFLMTGDRQLAAEQVQEAWLSAWRGLGGFQPGRPLKPWLLRILVNGVLAQRRKRSLPTVPLDEQPPIAAAATDDVAGAQLAEAETRQLLRQALAQLTPEHRQVVTLRYFAGLTVPEVAQAANLRPGTVKSRLNRALEQLRRRLGETAGWEAE